METNYRPKNTFKLQLKKEGPQITVSSDFDSGNMAAAQLGLSSSIIITPANDCSVHETPSQSKGWFYFSVAGVSPHSKVKFIIKKMQQLSTVLKFTQYFRPVYKTRGQDWERVEQATVFVCLNLGQQTKEEDTQLHFDFNFSKNSQVFFAYTFPFSFNECESLLKHTLRDIKSIKNLYYKDQIMIRSYQKRPIHLLTVSSIEDRQDYKEPVISEQMFQQGERPNEFKENKKIVIISARVHPGEAPSSHTFNGLLKFLLSNDARAVLLRKHFVFKLIPMLNPDGVYHGHYRMDTFGQNLNRFYQSPSFQKQSSVYAMRKLGQYYNKRLCFYLDLHAHPQRKGNFIYGNAMDNNQLQVQTQLFARILSLNCVEFDYFNSSFSKYHMNAKDKNEELTKQGCGRVVFNTHFQVKFAYTMQCGYTCSNYLNQIMPIQNAHRKFDKFSILPDELQNLKSPYYNSKKNVLFTIRSYQNLGKNILVSLLDLFELNPASRIPNTSMKSLNGIRQQILDLLNKSAIIYKDKIVRTTPSRPIGRLMISNNQRINKGYAKRAPSIESSKEIGFNKLRNRTLAKVNIGMF